MFGLWQMHAKTTVALSSDFAGDRLWLNGAEETVASNPRLVNCLREVRRRATKHQVGGTSQALNEPECRHFLSVKWCVRA